MFSGLTRGVHHAHDELVDSMLMWPAVHSGGPGELDPERQSYLRILLRQLGRFLFLPLWGELFLQEVVQQLLLLVDGCSSGGVCPRRGIGGSAHGSVIPMIDSIFNLLAVLLVGSNFCPELLFFVSSTVGHRVGLPHASSCSWSSSMMARLSIHFFVDLLQPYFPLIHQLDPAASLSKTSNLSYESLSRSASNGPGIHVSSLGGRPNHCTLLGSLDTGGE